MARTKALATSRILVVEDDYYLATDLQRALEAAGATVIGPVGGEADAVSVLTDQVPDCAFLDVNLGAGPTFAIPRHLSGSGIPFAFVTGYDAGTIPEEFMSAPRLEKPVEAKRVVETASRLLRREEPRG